MEETIFSKIAKKEIPAYIVHENAEFMAFLDIFPSGYAQTLVIPKQQKDSYFAKNDTDFLGRFIEYTKSVAILLDSKLGSLRCILMLEGFEVNHLHAKLYPIFTLQEAIDFNPRKKDKLEDSVAKEILGKLV
jgi:histidine triad (HIT) family protein